MARFSRDPKGGRWLVIDLPAEAVAAYRSRAISGDRTVEVTLPDGSVRSVLLSTLVTAPDGSRYGVTTGGPRKARAWRQWEEETRH